MGPEKIGWYTPGSNRSTMRADAKRAVKRYRRRLEKLLLDETPVHCTRGWCD